MALDQGFLYAGYAQEPLQSDRWYAGAMLMNRYTRTDRFALVPQLGLRFEP